MNPQITLATKKVISIYINMYVFIITVFESPNLKTIYLNSNQEKTY